MLHKRTFLLWLLCLGTLPVAAQTAGSHRTPKTRLDYAVERAVASQQQTTCTCAAMPADDFLSEESLIQAEIELQRIRNTQDSSATFTKYPYLLDPAYRRQHDHGCTCGQPKTQPAAAPAVVTTAAVSRDEDLTTQELIEAEEELTHIRSTDDPQATFEKYPYLLDPAYRRADESQKPSIRRFYGKDKPGQFTPAYEKDSTWARKVGL